MKRHFTTLLLLSLPIAACGVPEKEHARVLAERDSLAREVDDLRFGAERLLSQASNAMAAGNPTEARTFATTLLERHPAAAERAEAEKVLAQAEREITAAEAKARQDREQAEREERRKREEAERAEKAARERALASTRKKRDEMRGITFYAHRTTPEHVNSRSDIHLYLAHHDGGRVVPRLKIQYEADEWLFIQSYIIKADDRTFNYYPGRYDEIERDNGYGGIWEWLDVVAGDGEMQILRAIANSTTATIRHEGRQYYKDRTITAREKQAIREMLTVMESLNSAGT